MLASASPRRRELLALTGCRFDVRPAPVDETPRINEAPEAFVQRMSREKAQAARAALPPGWLGLVLAADTEVEHNGRILGKPAGPAEAQAMLESLRGQTHWVLSAVTVLHAGSGRARTELACTQVPMRAYTDEEISDYVASGDPFDKAGAYAIQHAGFHPVAALGGCFANVMGLPLCHLTRVLREFDVALPPDLPQTCQEHTGYACPVYQDILEGRL